MPYYLFRFATLSGGQYWQRPPRASTSRAIQGGATRDDEPRNSNGTWPQDSSDITCIIDSTRVSSLAFLADGRLIMSASRNNNYRILIWVAEHGRLKEMESPTEHEEDVAITAVVACGDGGRYLVSGDEHGKLIFWEDVNTSSFRKVKELEVANSKITALDVCSDSLRVVSGSEDGQVIVWCMQKKERLVGPLRNENSSAVLSVKFSPIGDRIASAHDLIRLDVSSIRIWHSCTGAQLWSIPMTSMTYSLAWSADGRRLFAGASFGSIKYFDVVTQSLLAEWRAPYRDLITTLCTTLEDRFLVSASSGRTSGIDIWDISPDTFPSTPLRSRDGVRLATISRDNARLATVEEKNKVSMWTLSSVIDGFSPYCRLPPLTKHGEPFTYVSNAVYGAWKSGNLELAEKTLSKEIEEHTSGCLIWYQYANRALIRVRRKYWDDALRDADAAMSSDGPIPMIAYIAKGLATYRGKRETMCAALDVFESALHDYDANVIIKDFIQSIKDIAISDDTFIALSDTRLCRLVRARKLFLCANTYKDAEDFEKVMVLLDKIPNLGPLLHAPEVKTISLIFDWNISSLISDIHQLRCQALCKLKSNCSLKKINYFSAGEKDLSEVLESTIAKLSLISEKSGDEASLLDRHDEAFAWYSEALVLAGCSLDIVNGPVVVLREAQAVSQCLVLLWRRPKCIAHLFANRSKIKARLELWEDALTDAEWAIQADASHSPGYHRKYVALHAMGRYEEACATLSDLSSNTRDSEKDELKKSYLSLVLDEIDRVIDQVFSESPFILIDVEDGRLCDQKEQKRRFKMDSTFSELVSSMVSFMLQDKAPETVEIEKVVRKYFLYVMLSHTWEDQEPLFHDVSGASVYQTSFMKLVKFCKMVQDSYEQYRWSWNDTCCIDKTDADKYQKSISSMYKWYSNSALTLVLLADPSQNPIHLPNDPTPLAHNRWMFRAWTLQELLAPKIIRFYYRTWELYLGDDHFNHKDSPRIKSELARATGIEEDTLVHFSPEGLPVREKLRVASNRKASVDVDIAYSLLGIFRSDIIPDYNRHDAETALGLLLQEIIQRRGDVTVLDWFGKPSRFHSSLPADISVYGQTPYKLPSITDDKLDKRVEELSRTLPEQEVTDFYSKLIGLDPPTFDSRKLKLPCIMISVTGVTSHSGKSMPSVYVASTAALGTFEFSAKNAPSSGWCQEDVVLVYPWIHELIQEINRREGNEWTKALRVVAYLERGFRAFLFAKQLHTRERVGYRRVAAEQHINIPTHELICWKGVGAKSLEIFD